MTPQREFPEGQVPLLSFEGTSIECGEQLGVAWQHPLRLAAETARGRFVPWWWKGKGGVAAELVEQIAPHLVDLYRGMARGAEIPEELCYSAAVTHPLEACTSFAVHKDLTLDQVGISGQTKDTSFARTPLYQVLRLKPSDAPGYLALTYPGDLLGYGFAATGMSIFRNSLYVTPPRKSGALTFDAFGLLALFSKSLDSVIELAKQQGVRCVAHCAIADSNGRGLGFELGDGEVEIIPGRDGLYAHANHTVAARFKPWVTAANDATQRKGASEHRDRRLYELMEQDRGRLTPQLMMQKLSDHANYPASICSHRDRDYHTTSAVVVEPTRGRLHVTRGAPCQNWPVTYQL